MHIEKDLDIGKDFLGGVYSVSSTFGTVSVHMYSHVPIEVI
jgi:hypothetical protein